MKVELCPKCGSGKVSRISALGDDYQCFQCAWKGKEREILATDVATDSQEIALRVAQNLLVTLTRIASIPVGQALFESGLLQKGVSNVVVARILRATLTAGCMAALKEVDLIQKEMADGTADTRSS